MNLISRIMEKRGIKNVEDLDREERATLERWEKILSESEITVNKIREFCAAQISTIEGKWRANPENPSVNLIHYHNVYKTLLSLIDGPRSERENLERYLNQLLEK